MFREEWPSDHKLERLREQGKAPRSHFASVCAVSFVVVLWLLQSGDEWRLFLQRVNALPKNPESAAMRAQLRELSASAASMLVIPCLFAAAAVLAAGLGQTKFLFKPQLLAFSLEKLRPKMTALNQIPRRIAAGIAGVAVCSAFSFLCVLLLYPRISRMLSLEANAAIAEPAALLKDLAPIAVGTFALCTLGAWLAGRFMFLMANRMTRREAEEEESGRQ